MVSTNHLGVSQVITNMLTSSTCLYKVTIDQMSVLRLKTLLKTEPRAPGLTCQFSTTEL